jgi:hypothetical protein
MALLKINEYLEVLNPSKLSKAFILVANDEVVKITRQEAISLRNFLTEHLDADIHNLSQ